MPSVMTLAPFARQSAAANWGCMSVGKPGYGMVLMLTRLQACRVLFTDDAVLARDYGHAHLAQLGGDATPGGGG